MKFQGKIKELDFRVSTLPTLHGEKIVMRLLDKDSLMLDMTKLGFEKSSLKNFEEAIFQPVRNGPGDRSRRARGRPTRCTPPSRESTPPRSTS